MHEIGMGWDGMGWDRMGWGGVGWDGLGWVGMGWVGMANSPCPCAMANGIVCAGRKYGRDPGSVKGTQPACHAPLACSLNLTVDTTNEKYGRTENKKCHFISRQKALGL